MPRPDYDRNGPLDPPRPLPPCEECIAMELYTEAIPGLRLAARHIWTRNLGPAADLLRTEWWDDLCRLADLDPKTCKEIETGGTS